MRFLPPAPVSSLVHAPVSVSSPPPSFWSKDNIQAFLSGVPNDKMIILDLNTEAGPVFSYTDNYFGKVRHAVACACTESVHAGLELPCSARCSSGRPFPDTHPTPSLPR